MIKQTCECPHHRVDGNPSLVGLERDRHQGLSQGGRHPIDARRASPPTIATGPRPTSVPIMSCAREAQARPGRWPSRARGSRQDRPAQGQ